ncbi:hypothetical protein DXG01_016238 [Tephrocybe rancida]|nr:hypothetical protein DXG01_016238 [Tephrocybe rancida]
MPAASKTDAFTPVKAGIYGVPRPVTFAPNITPVSYVEDDGSSSSTPGSPTSALFPPSATPAPPPTRRRAPPGKRRSMGYIPRPPNAFMLFRADFVRQKHVPGTIETNHGSLSKIIGESPPIPTRLLFEMLMKDEGNCWRALPLDEKKTWEIKAKHAKAEHKARYPEYRFRPVHNKNKDKKKDKPITTVEDERRCEEVAQLLLEGKKGDELAAAVRDLDLLRSETPNPPVFHLRRSSSVPLPNDYYHPLPHQHFNLGIQLPNAPLFASRPSSPLNPSARNQQRMMLGNRRASSARPAVVHRSWTLPADSYTHQGLQRDDSPLPEVDASLFNPNFFGDAAASSSFFPSSFGNDHFMGLASEQAFGPLDGVSPHDVLHQHHPQGMYTANSSQASLPELDPMSWLDPQLQPHSQASATSTSTSHPSTAYSGSPAPSEPPLPAAPVQIVHAPQPQSAAFDMWREFEGGSYTSANEQGFPEQQQQQHQFDAGLDFGGAQQGMGMGMGCVPEQSLESLFNPVFDEGYTGYADLGYA